MTRSVFQQDNPVRYIMYRCWSFVPFRGIFPVGFRLAFDSFVGRMNSEDTTIEAQLHDALVNDQDWERVETLIRSHPSVCQSLSSEGRPILYYMCGIGATPASLIELVASIYPAAIALEESMYGDTCLHSVCRSCQLSSAKLQILLRHCEDPARLVLQRNRLGGTALHSAAHHNAVIDALRLLVETNPACVQVRSHEGLSVVAVLWSSFLQTIPGHMEVGSILMGKHASRPRSNMFRRFWEKMEYLGLETYKANVLDTDPSTPNHLLHGLLLAGAPLKLFLLCLRLQPSVALAVDPEGNTPLHRLVRDRPYRTAEQEAILAAAADVSVRNHRGELPLHIAIRNRMPYQNGMERLVPAKDATDWRSGLPPFLLAAEQGGRVAVDTTWNLLVQRPDFIVDAAM